jgi:hypothetical protein
MIIDLLVVVCILLSLQFLALVGIFVAILVKLSPGAKPLPTFTLKAYDSLGRPLQPQ